MKTHRLFSSVALLSFAAFQLGAQAPVPNPTSLSLSAPLLSTSPVSQSLTLTGPPSELWRVQANGGFWLLFTTPTCPTAVVSCVVTSPLSGSLTVTAILDPSTINLQPYTYNGSITVSYGPNYAALDAPKVTIPISFTIGGTTNALSATPSSLSFTAAPNGAPQTQNLSIGSTGAPNSIYFATTSNASWLTTSLGGSSTFAPASLTVTANPAGLSNGSYQGTLTFTPAGGTAAVITVPVTLVVGSSTTQQLVVNPTSVAFGPGVSSVPVSINVNSGSQVPYTVTISYPGLAALKWLTASTLSGQTGSTLILSATGAASLPAGTGATVTISSPGLTSVNIPVTLNGPVSPGTGQFVSSVNPIFIGLRPAAVGSQVLTLSTSTGAAVPYTITTQYSTTPPEANWLTVSEPSGTTPRQITVTANAGSLGVGGYGATLIITSTTPGFTPLSIPVTMNITDGASLPTVLFSPGQFSFTAPVNGTATDQTLSLTSSIGSAVPYSLTSNASWLSVLTSSGSTPGLTTVRVNPAGLLAGTYTGSITMTAAGAVNNGATIPVTLTVTGTNPNPGLSLNPTSLRFVAQVNGGFPPSQNVQVTGSAGSYTVASNQPWLLVTPASGTTPGSLTVQANPTGLSAGTYNGTVTLTSGSISTTLAVTLLVTTNASLQLSQQSVTFNYQTAATPPLPRAVLVTSSNGAPITYSTTVLTANGGSWLQALPVGGTTPSSITLSLINSVVSTLPAGTYSGTVTVNAPTAANVSSVINVTLNVSATSLLTMSTAAAAFNAQSNGAVPPPQTRQITASSGVLGLSVSTSTSTGSGWLTATLSSNVTPATLTISVSPAGLSTGLFSGSVTVSSGGSGALTIPVTMNVISLPVINVDKSELVFGGPNTPVTQNIQLSSSSGNLPFEVSTSVMGNPVQWLSVNPLTGSTPSTLTVTVNPGQLAGGTYSGLIMIYPQSAGAPPISIPVTLIINQTSTLQVSPGSLSFTQATGGALAPAQTLQVTSQTPVPFTFTSTVQTPTGGTWLTVTQPSSLTNGTLQVSLNSAAASLPSGNYTALINVLGSNSPNIVQIPVSLTVTSSANLPVAVPSSLSFVVRPDQPNPAGQTVQVNSTFAGSSVFFNVLTDQPWLRATPLSGTTPIALTVSVVPSAIPSGLNGATGHITLVPLTGGQSTVINVLVTIEQSTTPAITAYANAATFQPGSLSPGMLFSIIGRNLGPAQATPALVVNGRFPTQFNGVRVLFDGIAAPLLYVSSTQINAAVPYVLQGRAFSLMTVEYNGVASNTLSPRIENTAPGIFTTDGRQAAALNEDGTVNSAASPASAGSLVVLYVTGEGQTTPAGVDGEVVPANNLKKPLATVRVRVNGADVPAADIVYAGSAPELVSGLMQINFKLPANTPASNATPVEVSVGAAQSPVGTTIAVR